MKKAFLRGLIGFPIGVTVGYAITIAASLALGQGRYAPVVPDMAADFGSETAAVCMQFMLCGLMGFVFAAMSVVWENDRLNLAVQSLLNFAVSVCTMIPIAYICHWMEHTLAGALSYAGVFAGIYASIWVAMYFVYRAKINEINRQVQK